MAAGDAKTYTPEKEVQTTMMNNTANKQLAADAAAVVIAEASSLSTEGDDEAVMSASNASPAMVADAR
jgi:hypothetical protein